MFRRCVASLVLLGFVAGQLAAVPHAHGGYSAEQRREHDARPHIHLGHGKHSHDAHLHGEPEDAASAEHAPHGACRPLSTHEADAIYLALGVSRLPDAKSQRPINSTAAIVVAKSCLAGLSVLPDLRSPGIAFHPPNDSAGTKLILILRTLRI